MIELCTKRPLRVAAYARISTEEEIAEEGSFENQKLFFENEIKEHRDWTLAEIYGDYAKSGMQIAGRDDFQRMLRDAQRRDFDYILTKSISRFARNTADCVDSVRKLKAAGVNIYFMEQGLDTASEFSELVLTVLASIAEMECESTRENILMTHRHMNALGTPVIPARYGYRRRGTDWIVVPNQAKRVKIIYLFAAHGVPLKKIERFLNEMEHEEDTGKVWSVCSIRTVLGNEIYFGDIFTNKTCMIQTEEGRKDVRNDGFVDRYYIDCHHEPIISRELGAVMIELHGKGEFAGQRNYKPTSLLEARAAADNDTLLDEVRDYLIGVETLCQQYV